MTADVAEAEGLHQLKLSGTKFRKMLRAGEDIPEWCGLLLTQSTKDPKDYRQDKSTTFANGIVRLCSTLVPPFVLSFLAHSLGFGTAGRGGFTAILLIYAVVLQVCLQVCGGCPEERELREQGC